MHQIMLGNVATAHFPVFETDGYTKKTGETVFTVSFWHDGVVVTPSYSITEIGSSGEYLLSFTPDLEGVWSVDVLIDYNKEIRGVDFQVSKPTIQWGLTGSDDLANVTLGLWGERDGDRVTDIDSMSVIIRDTSGSLVVDLGTNNMPTSDGVFAFTTATSNLAHQTAYVLDVSATRSGITWYANIGLAKA